MDYRVIGKSVSRCGQYMSVRFRVSANLHHGTLLEVSGACEGIDMYSTS